MIEKKIGKKYLKACACKSHCYVVYDNHLIDVFQGIMGQMYVCENEIWNISEAILPNNVSETIANGLVGAFLISSFPTSPLAMVSAPGW